MRWDDFDDSSGEKETDGIIIINRNHVTMLGCHLSSVAALIKFDL